MPRVISRAEAVHAVGSTPGCLVCRLLEPQEHPIILRETAACVALLPRYALRWGHVLIVPRTHQTRFADIADDTWSEANELALRAARAIEQTLEPLRCWVASLGTPREDIPMSCPHLHIHVVPIYDRDDKPSAVLTWSNGVWVGTEEELRDLSQTLRAAWQ